VTAETGYFKVAEIEVLQGVGIPTVIPDFPDAPGEPRNRILFSA
jgi:hypothetical protein